MTITLTKTKLAIAVLAVALIAPTTAVALHATGHTNFFDDVPDEAFYAEAADWAKTNGITTGSPAGSRTFKPLDGVTRGENVTFAKRYDDNIVQPALSTLTAGVATNTTAIGVLETTISDSNAIAFASATPEVDLSPEVPTTLLTLDITIPVDGALIVNGNANIVGDAFIAIDCWINIDVPAKNSFHGVQHLADGGYVDEWADNLGFEVTAGDHTLYLGCQQMNGIDADTAKVQVRRMTAVFSANSL